MHEIPLKLLTSREDPNVCVHTRRCEVVVARCNVCIGKHTGAFLADNEAHLAVDLQTHHAVDNVHACLFKCTRPLNVGFFIKARLQLNEGRNVLAKGCGALERFDHRGPAACAIERDLDRKHVRIFSSSLDKPHNGIRKRIEWVVHEDVAILQHIEDVLAIALELRDLSGGERHVLQAAPVQLHQR